MSELVGQGSKYSDEDRRRAVVEYFVTGNMKLVAERTGIPRTTLGNWKQSDWWVSLMGDVRHEKGEEFDANLTKLIDSAFENAKDRIENGDFRVSKDGELIRVPMSGRDLVTSGAILYDKQRLHRNEPTAIKGDTKSLEELKRTFEQLSRRHRLKMVNAVDGECEEVEE